MNNENELTTKQRLFVSEYLASGNASQAYLSAGYSASSENVISASASRLLRNAKIASAVASGKALEIHENRHIAQSVTVDKQWLIYEYLEIIQGAKEAGHWNASRGALTDLAKLTGFMLERKEIAMLGAVDHHLSGIDTEELLTSLQAVKTPKILPQS